MKRYSRLEDKLNWVNIFGILVCLAGLVMVNWKR